MANDKQIRTLDILFGSETGNSESLSMDIKESAISKGFSVKVHDMIDVDKEICPCQDS